MTLVYRVRAHWALPLVLGGLFHLPSTFLQQTHVSPSIWFSFGLYVGFSLTPSFQVTERYRGSTCLPRKCDISKVSLLHKVLSANEPYLRRRCFCTHPLRPRFEMHILNSRNMFQCQFEVDSSGRHLPF